MSPSRTTSIGDLRGAAPFPPIASLTRRTRSAICPVCSASAPTFFAASDSFFDLARDLFGVADVAGAGLLLTGTGALGAIAYAAWALADHARAARAALNRIVSHRERTRRARAAAGGCGAAGRAAPTIVQKRVSARSIVRILATLEAFGLRPASVPSGSTTTQPRARPTDARSPRTSASTWRTPVWGRCRWR